MNPLQTFLAARAAKAPKQPVSNADQPVTRAEFDTVVRAVNALIEDVDAVTSPGKLAAVINEALDEAAAKGVTPTTTNARAFLAPAGDDDLVAPPRNSRTGQVANADRPVRKPLALKPDRAFLAPKGE